MQLKCNLYLQLELCFTRSKRKNIINYWRKFINKNKIKKKTKQNALQAEPKYQAHQTNVAVVVVFWFHMKTFWQICVDFWRLECHHSSYFIHTNVYEMFFLCCLLMQQLLCSVRSYIPSNWYFFFYSAHLIFLCPLNQKGSIP